MNKKLTVKKAIIPCAGYGTRFMPATKGVPKELFPIVDKPAILYLLQECYKSGIKEVLLITNKNKQAMFEKLLSRDKVLEEAMTKSGIIHYLDELNEVIDNLKIDYIIQPVMNGTAGAISLAKEWANGEPCAMMFGDDLYDEAGGKPCLLEVIEWFEKIGDGKTVVGSKMVSPEEIVKYSSIRTTRQIGKNCFEFDKMIEKPRLEEAPSLLSGLGRYVLQADIFDYIKKTPKSKNGEIGITDTFNVIAEDTKAYCVQLQANHYDLGNKARSLTAMVEFALKRPDLADEFKSYLKSLKLD